MRERRFGRLGWQVSEIGYGMWGLAGWTGSNDDESRRSLHRAVALGCTFFDTAWAYGAGRSERLLGEVLRRHPGRRLYVATKIPPKNMRWPASPEDALDDVFPADHVRDSTERSLENLGIDSLDLLQFHVWSDTWAERESWQQAVADLKHEGLIRGVGISVGRRQPTNVLRAVATGAVDAVQVVYNVFDQAAEDELFPECQRRDIAVIARVPFDEGSLTGALTATSRWPDGDLRNSYFSAENLAATVPRVEALKQIVPASMDLPEMALRLILANAVVSTTIPGMRKLHHVEANLAVSDGQRLEPGLVDLLRGHRWDRRAPFPV